MKLTIRNTTFEGKVSFNRAIFPKYTTFSGANFKKKTVFTGARFGKYVNFSGARFWQDTNFWFAIFGEITRFSSAQFVGEIHFDGAQFQLPADFKNIKYWSDSLRVTLARWLWKDGKFLRDSFLPENSPECKPREPTKFYLDSRNFDEVSNPHFKRYVGDQQYIRSLQENNPVVYRLWRRTANCGRSLSLWAFWCLLIALFFACAYVRQYMISGAFLAISGVCLLDNFRGKKGWIFLLIGLIVLVIGSIFSVLDVEIKGIEFKDKILLLLLLLFLCFDLVLCGT